MRIWSCGVSGCKFDFGARFDSPVFPCSKASNSWPESLTGDWIAVMASSCRPSVGGWILRAVLRAVSSWKMFGTEG